MEKTLERGQEKIQQICDMLRKDTLEPAENEAQLLVQKAKEEAAKIIENANEKAAQIEQTAHLKIEQKRTIFRTSLDQAVKQSLEALKQQIEKQLFSPQLSALVQEPLRDPHLIAKLISALVEAVGREGLSANFSAVIPNVSSVEEINKLLTKQILDQLREKSVLVGHIAGGAQLKLHDRKMICDMSNEAVLELLSAYIRKDFREQLFGK